VQQRLTESGEGDYPQIMKAPQHQVEWSSTPSGAFISECMKAPQSRKWRVMDREENSQHLL